jgi:hypothetical protein
LLQQGSDEAALGGARAAGFRHVWIGIQAALAQALHPHLAALLLPQFCEYVMNSDYRGYEIP